MKITIVCMSWSTITIRYATIPAMLGIGAFEEVQFHLQTLKDNVGLLTPELLDDINQS